MVMGVTALYVSSIYWLSGFPMQRRYKRTSKPSAVTHRVAWTRARPTSSVVLWALCGLTEQEALACDPQQQPALLHFPQKEQDHLLIARSPDGCIPPLLPLRAAAAAASSSSGTLAACLSFPQHQKSPQPLPSLSLAASPQLTTSHPPLMGWQRQAPLAWDVAPTHSTPLERLPISQPGLNAASREGSAAAGCCSSSSSLMSAAVLPVAPAEEQPTPFAQGAHAAAAEGAFFRPPEGCWPAQPAHPLPVSVELWQQQLGGTAAAGKTVTGLPVACLASARSLPQDNSAEGAPVGKPYDAGPPAAEAASVESSTQAYAKQQVLLQKLQQNEQMQRHILRNLQQQQQRWRHLLEACDAASLAGAPNTSTVDPCIPTLSGAPASTSPEALGLLQPEEERHGQVNPLPLQQSLQQRAPLGDAALLGASTVRRARRGLAGASSSTGRQRRMQAAAQLRKAPPLQLAEAAEFQAACQPLDHVQQSTSHALSAAGVPGDQGWAWQQQQQQQQHHFVVLRSDVSPTVADQAQQQPLSSWLPRTTQMPPARSEPLHVVPGELAPHAASRIAAVELEAASSIGGTVAAARADRSDDRMRYFRPPEEKQGLRRGIRGMAGSKRHRGRRMLGKSAGVQEQSKCGENQAAALKADSNKEACSPHSCSRSPSVARTAACAVLGFGSGMPPQTKLAENPKVGLVNLGGGSCFLNVVLQCLAHLQPLRDFYLHYAQMLPPSDVLGRQYEAYTSYLDPREMQDSDEFLRLLLDFLDGELRAAATGVPLHKALMMQAMPKKLEQWRPSRRYFGVEAESTRVTQRAHLTQTEDRASGGSDASSNVPKEGGPSSPPRSAVDVEQLDFADLPTLFSVFFEGAEVDKVRCTRCGRCTATAVPFKSLAIAMTQQAQEESCQHANDCDSLKLSSGEGYFCEQCNSKQDAVKSCSLVKDHLPFILCLTLKRFVRGKETYKIWNPVHFDEFVDLSRYVECSSDSDVLPEVIAAQDFKSDALEPGAQLLSSGGGPPSPAEEATAATGTPSVEEGLSGEASETGREGGGKRGESTAAHADGATHPLPGKSFCSTVGRSESSIPTNSAEAPSSQEMEKFTYELVALVEHEGPATEQGHYVCYVKHMVSEIWFRADDKVVEPVDLQRVLSACPYILFYHRSSEASKSGSLRSSLEHHEPAEMNAGFAGLRDQLQAAKGLSHGHWQQWQNLIARLLKPKPKISPNTTCSVKAGGSEDDLSSDVGKRFARQRRRIARLARSPWHAALDAPPEVSACSSHSGACPSVPDEGAMSADSQFNAAARAADAGRADQSPLNFPDTAGIVGRHCGDAYGGITMVQAAAPACPVVKQRRQEHLARS
ncbi:hypothetical protein ACSSS7_002826 [Eimeria intestinalis]